MEKQNLADELLNAIDEIVAPREIPRVTEPTPPQPVARVRLTRSVIVGGGYIGVEVRVGDIVFLTAGEIHTALCGGWGQMLEPLPKPTGTEPFYTD